MSVIFINITDNSCLKSSVKYHRRLLKITVWDINKYHRRVLNITIYDNFVLQTVCGRKYLWYVQCHFASHALRLFAPAPTLLLACFIRMIIRYHTPHTSLYYQAQTGSSATVLLTHRSTLKNKQNGSPLFSHNTGIDGLPGHPVRAPRWLYAGESCGSTLCLQCPPSSSEGYAGTCDGDVAPSRRPPLPCLSGGLQLPAS